ncbi:NAD(P)H-dependent glycerol-3-phosphate dehydrogenase [Phycisphaerales bacterium AB-hyl4]|uniref:Glycerol-3-phosphate dehydrogenase [NAD(P)+] n=1 Tax=Natronomicrosphaera hydrolytica TaxID=3242702 RepID=A0ABV4U1W2_9BACT
MPSQNNPAPNAPERISIIGDGSMATVCALLLESRGFKVTVWGPFADHVAELIQTRENTRYLPGYRLPEAVRLTADDTGAFRDADLVVNAIPTQYIRPVWARLAEHLPDNVPVASVAKGIEQDTMLRPTQIIADVLHKSTDDPDKPARPMASISGPSVASELARCLPATVCAASDDLAFAELLQQTFTTHWFRVYTNKDLLGVELAGATKNVIALAAGILDGLQAGNNAKSALLSRGLAEITRLGVAMGASQETFFGIAGVGDLATTCFSPTGRNRTCGEALGKGKKLAEVLEEIPGVVEGVPTTKAVVTLAEKYRVEMPITAAIHQVLFEGLDPLEAISQLMTRELKPERVG